MAKALMSRAGSWARLALPLAFCLLTPMTATAQAPGELVDWKADALDRAGAAVALSELYATMYNTRQLAIREVEVGKGDTPADIMRRSGSWPSYLGPANLLLDSVLCDMNRDVCRRERTPAKGEALEDISQNVGTTQPTDGDWSRLQPGALLQIPDYQVERVYETAATSQSYLAKRYGSRVRVERTGSLADLYCNQQPTACPGHPPLTWDGDRVPPILQFDPGQFDPSQSGPALPKDVIAAYLSEDSRAVLIAVPYLKLRQNLSLPKTGNSALVGQEEIQLRMDGNMLVTPELRTESSEALMDLNRALLGWMKVLPDPPDVTGEISSRIVTVYHFDKAAKLQHCLFHNLKGVQLMEWQEASEGQPAGPVPVKFDQTATDCALMEGVGIASRDHGTHTLGLLVGQLEAYASVLPPDITYFRVVHVPLTASEFESGTAPEASSRIAPVLEKLGPPNLPDVVSMSLSWPALGMDVLNQLVLSKEELITFVVAAPRQEGPDECARGPAGIKWPGGVFAENVISVVGLKVDGPPEQPDIVTVPDAGTGSSCHEIGAIGTLFGPVGETNAVDEMIGASQATPVVAATVAELIRRIEGADARPLKIADHLIASAWFDADMIALAKATLLDSSSALVTADQDLVITKSGCHVVGDYVQIRNSEGNPSEYFFKVGNDIRRVPSKKKLLSFRILDATRVLVVWLADETIRVEVGERQSGMDNRTIQFSPTQLSQPDCDGIELGKDTIPVSIVDQLIVSKLGG